MQIFNNDNATEYEEWIKNNPSGFVVNTTPSANHPYRTVHKVSCRFITGNDGNRAHATKMYIKVCTTDDPNDIKRLVSWFKKHKSEFDGEFWECGKCNPHFNQRLPNHNS